MIDKQELRRLAEEALPAWGLYPTNAQYAFSDALTPGVILALLDEIADMQDQPFEQLKPGKCLACGGYHPGKGSLPCPKFTPMAMDGKNG